MQALAILEARGASLSTEVEGPAERARRLHLFREHRRAASELRSLGQEVDHEKGELLVGKIRAHAGELSKAQG
eukprot:scaffold803_cov310-Pinguiococcus_pyrenoidosus.AAC.226